MEEKKISFSALGTAFYRGYHAAHDNPKIFDDFLAFKLLTEEEQLSFQKQIVAAVKSMNPALTATFSDEAAILKWVVQGTAAPSFTLSRARYMEDKLMEAVQQGVRQYVILGAGMDTFAFRHHELLEQIHVFEVDHPVTQAFKRQRLADLGWDTPKNLHFVPIDFTQENLLSVLKSSSFDLQETSFFSWMGVTYYLPNDVVFSTLKTIADAVPTGSSIVFDYLDADAFVPQKTAPRIQVLKIQAQTTGEPMITGFDPLILKDDLAGLGFGLKENLSPWEITCRYFMMRSDYYQAAEQGHFAWAMVE